MEHKCPHCGAPLPEESSFCPHCATDIHPRKQAKEAAPLLKKLLVGLLILVVAAAIGGAIWYCNRPYEPQEFDALGEVYYENGDKTYQLLVAWPNDRCAPASDLVYLYLPPVTYEGDLTLSRSYEFYGCTDEGADRTVLKGSVTMDSGSYHWINYFYDMDFVGDGTDIGIMAPVKAWAIGCSFTGYQTGFQSQGEAWVNVTQCTFTSNEVGFHFNSIGQSASDTRYHNNTFTNNGTAVLLENVPTDITLDFEGTVFSGNGTDVDNRCDHPIDLSKATLQTEG